MEAVVLILFFSFSFLSIRRQKVSELNGFPYFLQGFPTAHNYFSTFPRSLRQGRTRAKKQGGGDAI